jgi:CRP-like cAMP-binding protein
MYVICDGDAEVQIAAAADAVVLGRAQVFGEHGMFVGGTRTATIRARTKLRTIRLDYQRFRWFLLTFPEAGLALLGTSIRRLVRLQRGVGPGPAPAEMVVRPKLHG